MLESGRKKAAAAVRKKTNEKKELKRNISMLESATVKRDE
jgi:hypothetical protein